jgi:hypothetical protein
MDDQLRMRLGAIADATDDSDWLDVRRRARPAEAVAPRRVAPRRLIAACVALAAAITATVELLPRGDDAPRVLGVDAIAATAAAAPSTVPGPGEYAYTRRRHGIAGESGACTMEWWIARDGSGRVLQSGRLCSAPLRGTGAKRTGDGLDARFGPGEATRMHVALALPGFTASPESLPTDPDRLEAALFDVLRGLDDVNPESLDDRLLRSDGMLQMVDQVLANPLASPELRGALYRVAGRLYGVKLSHDVTDPSGRRGSAITLERKMGKDGPHCCLLSIRHELIFDPTTSRSLASRTTIKPGRDLPPSSTYHLYLEQAIVDSLDARP